MSWKKLKTLAIAILILMDSLFLFLILQRNYAATHYDEALINSATEIFRESELYVDRRFLSEKIVSYPVYAGVAEEDAVLKTVQAIEKAGYAVSDGPGGTYCTDSVGEFYFGDDFGFYYSAKGYYERPSSLLATERYIPVTQQRQIENVKKIVDAFLKRHALFSSEQARYRYSLSYSEVYSSGVNYIVTLEQTVDGIPIRGEICILVSGGRVVGADGIFATTAPSEREKAETIDLMNILFAEKSFLDERFRENGSFSYTPMVLADVSYAYTVYFDADGNFYFVPLCTVSYMNGESRTYNCVSGKLYS